MRSLLPIALIAIGFVTLGVASHADPLPEHARASRVVVEKSLRTLSLYDDGNLLKTYTIALGSNPAGHKQREGDGRTPKGTYVIDYRNPESSYHLSLHISYPDAADQRSAAARGVSPGGDIFIHGLSPAFAWVGALHSWADWTDGCIAVSDDEIEELWRAVANGTPIEIRP